MLYTRTNVTKLMLVWMRLRWYSADSDKILYNAQFKLYVYRKLLKDISNINEKNNDKLVFFFLRLKLITSWKSAIIKITKLKE